MSHRSVVLIVTALALCTAAEEPRFTPDWDSLAAGYQTPAWFRDAKFGIFMHWGPCSVPAGANDGWYGRQMYLQHGAPWGKAYQFHTATYGHPSVFGYKDIIPLWKAERWDPMELAAFYKACGARYLVPVAVHHDNVDLYHSTHQPWNSVNLGPKRDIIAGWKAAAAANGLRFGVSSHSDRTWGWFQSSRGSDTTGPKAGVRYDGWLTKADGVGTWWEGYDPQDLYSPPHTDDKGADHQRFIDNWRLRTSELLSAYEPDLVYFDGGLPFGRVGLGIAADFYNANRARHGGRLEAVLNIKGGAPLRAVTHDIEKGQSDRTLPFPWQTDTSLNNHWFADRLGLVLPDATSVLHLLADVVSKNGNLLLNVALEADGTLPQDQRAILSGVGAWLAVHGEAIYGTRPARTWGEGPTRVAGGSFNQRVKPYTAEDIRFTTKDGELFALILGRPADGIVRIRSLGTAGPFAGTVQRVSLVGRPGELPHESTPTGLRLTLPADLAPSPIIAVRISGLRDLEPDGVQRPDLEGVIDLGPYDAAIDWGLRVDDGTLCYWNDARSTASWRVATRNAGDYAVEARVANPSAGSTLTMAVGSASLTATMPATKGWNNFTTVRLGTVHLDPGDDQRVILTPVAAGWQALNLRQLRLVPITAAQVAPVASEPVAPQVCR